VSQYTVTSTPIQDVALNILIQQLNAATPAPNPPWTPAGYLQARAAAVLTDWANQQQPVIMGQIVAAWPTLSQQNRDAVATTLGYPELAGLAAAAQLKYLAQLGPDAFRALSVDQQTVVLHALGII
jgi:hypothetical protein